MTRYVVGENLPYFCTITILDWVPVFIDARYIDPLIESLNFCRQKRGLQLFAYAIMPNHLHMICAPPGTCTPSCATSSVSPRGAFTNS